MTKSKLDVAELFDIMNQNMQMSDFYTLVRIAEKSPRITHKEQLIHSFIDYGIHKTGEQAYQFIANADEEDTVKLFELLSQAATLTFDYYEINEAMKARKATI